jgi:hypothetical protein
MTEEEATMGGTTPEREGDGELRLRCACGWETSGGEDAVVAATQEHGLRLHNMLPTRDEVLAMAAATADAEAAPS